MSTSGGVTSEFHGRPLPRSVMEDMGAVIHQVDPYDRQMREKMGEGLFEKHQASFPHGSYERACFLLEIIGISFPAERLSKAYFDNLEALLGSRSPLNHEGQIVLGLGTGRCGSTSLAAAFRSVENSLSTHENPPMIFWQPEKEQLDFHMRRLGLLSRYFPLVFDAAHWWLNAVDTFFERLPQGKIVGLHRDMDACVTSFLKVKGIESGTFNHWALPNNGAWRTSVWDPCYPSYAVSEGLESNHSVAKGTQIQRYVETYNRQLQELARARPGQVMLISTESLDQTQVADRLEEFVGVRISMPATRLNVAAVDQEAQQSFRF